MSTLPIQFDFFAPKMLPQPDEALLPVFFIKQIISSNTVFLYAQFTD